MGLVERRWIDDELPRVSAMFLLVCCGGTLDLTLDLRVEGQGS